MKDIKLNLTDDNVKKESLDFLTLMSSSLKPESVVSVTLVNEDFLSIKEIESIFSKHKIFWYLNEGLNTDSLFVTDLKLKMNVPASLIITANNDNHFAVMNGVASGMIGEKECTARVFNIAKSLLRLSS